MKTINGFALMEVMLSLFLFSISLLLIETAVVRNFHQVKNILLAQRAIYQALSADDFLSKNDALAGQALNVWRQNIDAQLPSGKGAVNDDEVVVAWGGLSSCDQVILGDRGCIRLQL